MSRPLMTGVGPDLFEVLAAVGAVDILPAATIPPGRPDTRPDTQPDSLGAQVPAVLALSDSLSDRPAVVTGGADAGSDTLDGDPSSAVHLSDTLSNTSGAVSDTSSASTVVVPDPLTIAVELVRNDRQVAGSEDRGRNAQARTHPDRPDWAAVARPRGEPPGRRTDGWTTCS
jgi:hypothetical protein